MNAFRDFSFSTDGNEYENYLSDTISKEYDVSYDHPEEPVEEEYQEIFQFLLDLGYLDYEGIHDLVLAEKLLDWPLLKRCLIRYIREDTLLLEQLQWSSFHLNHDTILKEHLLIIRQRLAILTSLEGELSYNRQSLTVGSRNIYTRILHYRLKIFNQYNDNVSAPLSQTSIILAYRVSLIVGKIDHDMYKKIDFSLISKEQFNFLGNVKELLSTSLSLSNTPSRILVFRNRNQAKIPFNQVLVHNGEFIFSENSKEFKRKVKRQHINYQSAIRQINRRGSLDGLLHNQRNQLSLELLQVVLWMKSYYRSKLDTIWGDKSLAALQEFLRFETNNLEAQLNFYLPKWYPV